MNMIDYLEWRGDLTFSQDRLNEIDALIFSWLSYFEFENLNGHRFSVVGTPLGKIAEYAKLKPKASYENTMIASQSAMFLLDAASKTERFRNIKITDFENIFDRDRVIQFAAVTFSIDEIHSVVAFRGTDTTTVGWKEDCMLSYSDEIPGQTEALSYFERQDMGIKYTITGHSKGGNLALYTFLKTSKDKISSIEALYNFDGPGFLQKLQQTERYADIKKRIHTFIPETSIVGMLLEHEKDYTVIKSDHSLISQHNGMFWQIKGKKFETKTGTDFSSRALDESFRSFLNDPDFQAKDKEFFVETIFKVLDQCGLKDFRDLNDDKLNSMMNISKGIFTSLVNADRKQQEILRRAMKIFFNSLKKGSMTVLDAEIRPAISAKVNSL